MKISIVTPSFNQAEFLERTIRSVVGQTDVALQYVVCDGGSTDASVEIIRKYEAQIDHWESGHDGGQSAAINKGFRLCDGDILGWVNSDDVLMPGALKRVLDTFEATGAEVVYGDFVYIDEGDAVLRRRHVFDSFRYETLWYHDYLGQPATFFSRRLFLEVGGIDESLEYSMDWDLFLRMKRAVQMAHVPQVLAGYRLHSAAKTSQEWDPQYAACLDKIRRTNRPRPFGDREPLNGAYLWIYRWISLALRLAVVLRDGPRHYLRALRVQTDQGLMRSVAWRWKY